MSLAFCLRLAWGWTQAGSSAAIDALPDQREYLSIARNISQGHGAQFFDPRFEQTVYAYRLPGYPWLIVACACDPPVVRLVQALLDTSTVLAVFLLARSLLNSEQAGDRSALIAALLVAINPFLIYFSGLLLSETLFTAMLAWGMVLLLSPAARRVLIGAGLLLLAISVYVRPSAILLPVILALASVGFGSAGVRRALMTGLLILAILAPWAWRNAQPSVLGHWIWTTTNGGITAYDGWNPTAIGGSDQRFVSRMPELRGMGEIERSDYLARQARVFVLGHPQRAVKLAFLKLGRLWSPMPLSEQYSTSAYRSVALLYCVPFDLLVLAGLIRGGLSPRTKVFLLIPAIYLTVVHMASVGSLRYLLPAFPPMSVLAASLLPTLRPGRMG